MSSSTIAVQTTVTEQANGVVALYRGNTTKTGATTCIELCKLYAAGGDKLLYFGCVKKTDGDFINFGMPDNNENSEVLTYLPLNLGPWKCPGELLHGSVSESLNTVVTKAFPIRVC